MSQLKKSALVEKMVAPIPPELLLHVRLATPRSIELEFADGFCHRLLIKRLGMPVDRLQWDTVEASPNGEAMTVVGVDGETIPVDSSTLRYLVDADYADKISRALNETRLTRDEMRELATPPDGWTGESEDATP